MEHLTQPAHQEAYRSLLEQMASELYGKINRNQYSENHFKYREEHFLKCPEMRESMTLSDNWDIPQDSWIIGRKDWEGQGLKTDKAEIVGREYILEDSIFMLRSLGHPDSKGSHGLLWSKGVLLSSSVMIKNDLILISSIFRCSHNVNFEVVE